MSAILNFVTSIPVVRGFVTSGNVCDLLCDAEPGPGGPIFVVVHGTWGRHSRWTWRDSIISKQLRERWPNAGVYRFVWSGANSARSRLVAAEVLREKLEQLSSSHVGTKIIAIAHSHGGNVVAWASTTLTIPLLGAIYLNTPFIQVLDSSEDMFIAGVALTTIFVFLYFPLAIAIGLKLAGIGLIKIRPTLGASHLLLLVPLLAGFPLGGHFIKTVVAGWINAVRHELTTISNSVRRISNELVICVVGDEAGSGLGSVYFGLWVGRRIAGWSFFVSLALIILKTTQIMRHSPEQITSTLLGLVFLIIVSPLF